jgi:hypothetical protein
MRRAEILEGVRMLKRRDVLSRWEAKQIGQLEAAELMGVSKRMLPLRRSRQPLFRDAKGGREAGPAGSHPEPAPAKAGVGRAFGAALGIEHIAAFSPEARGRSERAFRTLQDRLPKGSRGPASPPSPPPTAICEVFVSACNARFAVAPAQPGSAFVAIGDLDLDRILCLEESRQVGNDNAVLWRRRRLQIPASPLRPHFVRPGQSAPAPRRHAEHLPRAARHCPIRAGRSGPCPGRLTPLGGQVGLWICG